MRQTRGVASRPCLPVYSEKDRHNKRACERGAFGRNTPQQVRQFEGDKKASPVAIPAPKYAAPLHRNRGKVQHAQVNMVTNFDCRSDLKGSFTLLFQTPGVKRPQMGAGKVAMASTGFIMNYYCRAIYNAIIR